MRVSLCVPIIMVLPKISDALILSPQTSPESIVQTQLLALQKDDIEEVFKYASPKNKELTGPSERFGAMVRRPPYHYLVNHKKAEILITSETSFRDDRSSWSCLVRVIPSSNTSRGNMLDSDKQETSKVVEYWWLLSRCASGPYKSCYMVDSVLPV